MSDPSPPYGDLHIYYLQGQVKEDLFWGTSNFIGNWQEGESAFLFFTGPAPEALDLLLRSQPELTLCDRFQMGYTEWQGGALKPFRAGRFSIFPAWAETDTALRNEEILLRLDPGVVFGAGTHPTTRDCLLLIDSLFQSERVSSALDIGTGTGILGAAAAKAGCSRVLAVDLNLLAAKTARKNFILNRVEEQAISVCGDATDFMDDPYDLLIANIHYEVMTRLIDSPGFLRKRWSILSGLLRSQARKIRYRLEGLPVEIIEERVENEGIWHTFFVKRASSQGRSQ